MQTNLHVSHRYLWVRLCQPTSALQKVGYFVGIRTKHLHHHSKKQPSVFNNGNALHLETKRAWCASNRVNGKGRQLSSML